MKRLPEKRYWFSRQIGMFNEYYVQARTIEMNQTCIMILVLMLFVFGLLPLTAQNKNDIEKELIMQNFHQEQAVNLFNGSWDLLLKENRNRADEDVLLNMVHASLHHWRQIGQPVNILRGEWMICHVYTLLKHKEEALYHAENVLRLMDEQKPGDWDLAYCYEAMARVQALHGNKAEFSRYHALATEAGQKISQEEDRKQFEADLNDEYWFDMK